MDDEQYYGVVSHQGDTVTVARSKSAVVLRSRYGFVKVDVRNTALLALVTRALAGADAYREVVDHG